MEKKLLVVFMKKNCRRLIKKNLEIKKYQKQKKQIICQMERIKQLI